jgi:hypothetical protein
VCLLIGGMPIGGAHRLVSCKPDPAAALREEHTVYGVQTVFVHYQPRGKIPTPPMHWALPPPTPPPFPVGPLCEEPGNLPEAPWGVSGAGSVADHFVLKTDSTNTQTQTGHS